MSHQKKGFLPELIASREDVREIDAPLLNLLSDAGKREVLCE